MEKVGRNDKCPCGSGKKYKNCHQQMEGEKGARNKTFIIGGLIALLILTAALSFYMNSKSSTGPDNAPKGQVWSPEHGHWHNVE